MRLRILPVIVGVLLLAGAGCSRQTEPTPSGDNNPSTSTDTGTVNGEKIENKIVLTGSVTGPYSVRLEWDPSDEVAASAEKWMIIEGTESDPAYPENYRYYFLRDGSYRDREWKNLPQGTSHFRVCAYTDGVCTAYSNNVQLELPGRTPGTK